ncbi:MAG: hypothetical protein QXN26_05625 [Thermoplasmataceae archaeon]
MSDVNNRELAEYLQCIGDRSILADRYLFKRAWGVYYAIWALSIALFIFLPYMINPISNILLRDSLSISVYILIVFLAIYFTSYIFTKTRRLVNLRDAIKHNTNHGKRRGTSIFILIALISAIIIIGSTSELNLAGAIAGASIFALIDLYIYTALKESFDRIPFEGSVAITTFLLSDMASAISIIITGNSNLYGELWLPALVGWLFAGFYSLYSAIDTNPDLNYTECMEK